ncbi:MAG: response regulator [Elusimicrobiota bacterium]
MTNNRFQNKNKILVVDDEKAIHRLFSRMLKDKEFKIQYVDNGQRAIEIVQNQDFDIIFLDIVMPEMNGTEVLKAIKTIKSHIPIIIMMTGYAVGDLVKESLDLGAVDCIYKPFDVTKILEIIKKYLVK